MPDHAVLAERLARSSELNITVTGRKSGKKITLPIWFVLDGEKIYLLPVKGSDTQWYKNALKNPSIGIEAGGAEAKLRVTAVTEAKQVQAVIEKFRGKYGAGDVKKYYSKFDAGVIVPIR